MDQMGNLLKKPKIIAIIVVFILIATGAMIVGAKEKNDDRKVAEIVYEYTTEEGILADKVKAYLAEYITMEERLSSEVANAAVQSYRTILASGVKVVSDEHTMALAQRIKLALEAVIPEEQITDIGLDALSNGICEIIWDTVLGQLDNSGVSIEEEYNEELAYLSDSIQNQIDELKKRNMSVSISANIKNNGVTVEELESHEDNLLSKIENKIAKLKAEIFKEIETDYGDVKNGEDGRDGRDGKDGKDGVNGANGKDGANGQNGAAGKDGENGKNGENGRDGINGKDGKDGINGKDGADGINGKDGADGEDGESVFLMFSEYSGGRNASGEVSMSPVQSNTTKYMGTAHAAGNEAPAEPEAYTWSEYKDYIMYTELDENGVPTLYIR